MIIFRDMTNSKDELSHGFSSNCGVMHLFVPCHSRGGTSLAILRRGGERGEEAAVPSTMANYNISPVSPIALHGKK